MEIPIGAEVACKDGLCGRSTYVILNPVTRKATHIVVQEKGLLHEERLVPIELVEDSSFQTIQLSCKKEKLASLENFVETHFIPADPTLLMTAYDISDRHMVWPYVEPEDMTVPVEEERIPPGELAVRRGAEVDATDGRVGHIDEFLVDPESAHITHLVMREGHLWAQKDVTIPVSQIDRIEEDRVYLKLDKSGIENLPAIAIHRWWV
jgi:uncharacterized protein YrrD